MPLTRHNTQRIAGIALALALAACAKVPPGDIAASLTIPSVNAVPFSPESLRGKPSLVLFVSPSCPYCAEELPAAQAAAKAANGNVVAVFVVGTAASATSAATRAHYAGPALLDDGTLMKRYDIKKVPYTLVLGPDGHAVDAFHGGQDEPTLHHALVDAR